MLSQIQLEVLLPVGCEQFDGSESSLGSGGELVLEAMAGV